MESILAALALVIIGYAVGSTKIINQGNEALVERLGKFHRKLNPGLNFVVPVLDTIVLEDTIREKVLDTVPQEAITKDNISLSVDAVVFWRVLDLERTYYAIEDLETALTNLVITTLRSEIGRLELEKTYASRDIINQALLRQLDEATATWGVKVTRVEVQNITPPKTVMESLEMERAAESKKRATILESQGTVESLEHISKALQGQPNSRDVLQYLIAQRYVDATFKIGESENSKVIFMDPKTLTEAVSDLLNPESGGGSNGSGNGANPG